MGTVHIVWGFTIEIYRGQTSIGSIEGTETVPHYSWWPLLERKISAPVSISCIIQLGTKNVLSITRKQYAEETYQPQVGKNGLNSITPWYCQLAFPKGSPSWKQKNQPEMFGPTVHQSSTHTLRNPSLLGCALDAGHRLSAKKRRIPLSLAALHGWAGRIQVLVLLNM